MLRRGEAGSRNEKTLNTTQSSPALTSPRRQSSKGKAGSNGQTFTPWPVPRLKLGPGLGLVQSTPRLRSPSTGGLSPRCFSGDGLLSPSNSVRSMGSRTLSQNRFILPEEEERLRMKGEQERVRAEAREQREQLREAQKLQEEQEHIVLMQKMEKERQLLKEYKQEEQDQKQQEKLERRDMTRAKLWDKYPKVSDLARGSPLQSPRLTDSGALSPRDALSGGRSPRLRRPPLPPQDQQALATLATPRPHLSSSSSADPLMSPRSSSWNLNLGDFSREEVHEMEMQRKKALAEKEYKISEAREAREAERAMLLQRQEELHLERAAEVEKKRLAKDQKRKQETAKRFEKKDQRELNSIRRQSDLHLRQQQEQSVAIQTHRVRERKVYMKQQQEEEEKLRKLREAGEKELQIREARERQATDRELRRQQLMQEQYIRDQKAQQLREAKEAAQEELRKRRILELEERRAKVLAVKAEAEERKRRNEEEKCYIYTAPPRMSAQLKAAAAEVAAEDFMARSASASTFHAVESINAPTAMAAC